MKRKAVSMILAVTMVATMAVGCGGSKTADTTAPADDAEAITHPQTMPEQQPMQQQAMHQVIHRMMQQLQRQPMQGTQQPMQQQTQMQV